MNGSSTRGYENREAGHEGLATKRCPQCGQTLFADMDICFGCLYDFRRAGVIPYRLPDPDDEPPLDEPDDLFGEGGAGIAFPVESDGLGKVAHRVGEAERPLSEAGRFGPIDQDGEDDSPAPEKAEASMVPLEVGLRAGMASVASMGIGARGLFIQTGDVDVVIPLTDRGVTIGRQPTNDVVLHSRAVSGMHVHLSPTDEGASVEELGATNPVLLHGREVDGRVELRPGDTLNVCGSLVTLVEGR